MPAVLALPAFWGAVSAGTAAGAGIYAANKQSNAATTAAQLTTNAANQAAELQSKAAADTLAFQKQQEANRQAEFNATQARNYQQYLDYQNRIAPFRNMGLSALTQLGQAPPTGQ